MSGKNGRGHLAHLLLVTCGVGIGLCMGELALRIALDGPQHQEQLERRASEEGRFFEYDPELGWKGKPLAKGNLEGTEVRLNSRGFREREIPIEKPGDVYRILLFGDSRTWGLGVRENERYSNRLEEFLWLRGVRAEVLNFGVNGCGTDQGLLLFNRVGAQYHPDLVILGFFWNDLIARTCVRKRMGTQSRISCSQRQEIWHSGTSLFP